MDIKCLRRVAADDVHIREVAIESFDQVAVELDAEIRRSAGDHLAKKLCDRTSSDAELKNDIVFVGSNSSSIAAASSGELGVMDPTLAGFFRNA